jgi:hypothetical protein
MDMFMLLETAASRSEKVLASDQQESTVIGVRKHVNEDKAVARER